MYVRSRKPTGALLGPVDDQGMKGVVEENKSIA